MLLLSHERGIQIDPAVAKIYTNQAEHDPLDLTGALRISNRDDVLPIGLLFHDPERPRYEECSMRGMNMTADEKLDEMNKELDRFAI